MRRNSMPSLDWPKIYNMVNLGGLDLALMNGSRVPGIYSKITAALTADKIEVFYHWYFASIMLPPSKVHIDTSVANQYIINEEILVKSDDTVGIIGFIRIPIIEPLTALENKIYNIPSEIDGFGPVTVNVPIPVPTLVELNATENDTYLPAIGQDGFSKVVVNVPDIPPVVQSLSVTENGDYTPPSGVDGFSPVHVAVPAPVLTTLSVTENGDYTPGQGVEGFSSVHVEVPTSLYPYIAPEYFGLSYGYIGTNGNYYSNPTNTACCSYYHVSVGKYVAFAGENISNRLRIQFYAGKTYSDFEQYAINPAQNERIYQCTTNITGGTDLTGIELQKRIFFTVQSSGVVIITTSNVSVINPTYLFKIS